MERSGRHLPKAATVANRAALVSEETGSAFHPRGGLGGLYTNTNTAIYGASSYTRYHITPADWVAGIIVLARSKMDESRNPRGSPPPILYFHIFHLPGNKK